MPRFLNQELFTIYKLHRLLIAEIILVFLSTLFTPFLETGYQGAKILTHGEALWWSLVTVTSTGYGDYVPVSLGGRIVGTILMFSGFALYSAALGIFVLFINRHQSRRNWQKTNLHLEELSKKLDRIEKQETFLIKENAKKQ